MRQRFIGVLIVALMASMMAAAKKGDVMTRDWQNLSPHERLMYVVGLVAGFDAGVAAGTPTSRAYNSVLDKTCWYRMTYGQLLVVLDEHIKEHPEVGNVPLDLTVRRRLKRLCDTK